MTERFEDDLRRINERIPAAENERDRLFFEQHLATVFAFRRANGAMDSREMFLLSLEKPEDPAKGPRSCDPRSIEIVPLGESRAIVNCVVTRDGSAFYNTRLFVKDVEGWKLLAWANEAR